MTYNFNLTCGVTYQSFQPHPRLVRNELKLQVPVEAGAFYHGSVPGSASVRTAILQLFWHSSFSSTFKNLWTFVCVFNCFWWISDCRKMSEFYGICRPLPMIIFATLCWCFIFNFWHMFLFIHLQESYDSSNKHWWLKSKHFRENNWFLYIPWKWIQNLWKLRVFQWKIRV